MFLLKITLVAILGFALPCISGAGLECRAQRTMRGQFFVTGLYSSSVYPGSELGFGGGEAYFGQYFNGFYWDAGVSVLPVFGKNGLGCSSVSAGAAYRMYGTRNRMVNLYAGGRVFAGVDYGRNAFLSDLVKGDYTEEEQEAMAGEVPDADIPVAETKFMYGIAPRLEAEFFPLTRLALVAGLELPVKFISQGPGVSLRLGIGVRYNF